MKNWICKSKDCKDSCLLIVRHREVKYDIDDYTPKQCPFVGYGKKSNWMKLVESK